MGEVWACFDIEEKRVVAVKIVLAKHVSRPWVRRLFQAEVVAVARLSHVGIVDVYDLVALPDGGALLVMAFRPGKPLDYAAPKLKSWRMIRGVMLQLLEALAHAHARNVLHLDLKPANVLVDIGPPLRTTLVDFGIARIKRPGKGAETWHKDGSVFGTLEYMAPEQWRGELEKLGPWTDLYSLGVMAHELCTGLLPFEDGPDTAAASRRRLLEPTPPMIPKVTGIPRAFIDLCARLLDLNPVARPSCAADVLAELEEMGEDEETPISLTPPPSSSPARTASLEAVTVVATPSESALVSPPSEPGRSGPFSTRGTLTSRWRLGVDAEEAFNTEQAPPTPGAYGLFGLRELPVLGRVEERRALWRAVRATAERGAPSAVILTGPAGTGKSRLARDAVERALELGLAVTLQTHWSAGGSPDEGLRGLVENALESRGSQGADFDARLLFFMERFPAAAGAFLREARVLLRPQPDAAPDAGLPARVATDVILRAAAHRPVILRLDDVHWSRGEAAELVRALITASPACPVCIIASEREEEAGCDYSEAFETLAGSVDRVAMLPLGASATNALVRGLLDLDDDLADIIARRSEGNPLFASQLVGQLVLERAIERRAGRYVLAGNVDVDRIVPPDMGAVWWRAISVSGAVEEDLMALALVRERVSSEVVDALANILGDRFNTSLTNALGAGLVRKEGDLFSFSHGLLRDYLIERVPVESAPSLHAAAADALTVLVGREDVEESRAQHLRAAGRNDEAVHAMLAAAMWSWRRAERPARQRRLVELLAWSWTNQEAIAIRARALAELAHCHAEGGSAEQANLMIERARQELERASGASQFDRCAAWVHFRDAQVSRLQGRVVAGGLASEAGIDHARRAEEPEVEGLCVAQLGLDAYRRGDHAAAAPMYDRAIELVRRSGNRATEAHILMVKSGLEEPGQMEASCRAAVEMAREAGAVRIELLARQAWTEALFRIGQRERALRETKALSAAAQRCSLRQIASLAEGVAACWAVMADDWTTAMDHRRVAEQWGASTGAIPERATAAAIDLALALAQHDGIAAESAIEVLLREGRTYAEPHFCEVVRKLLVLAPSHMRTRLLILDAAGSEA